MTKESHQLSLLSHFTDIWKESKFDISSVLCSVAINFKDSTDGRQILHISNMSDIIRDSRPSFYYHDKLTFSLSNKTKFGNINTLTLIFLNDKFDVHVELEDSKRI